MNNGLSSDDIVLEIKLLAETKGAVRDVKILEEELVKLRAEASKTKATLKGLFDSGAITAETYSRAVKKVNTDLGDTPANMQKVEKGLVSMDNVARTAFGTFVAMGIFLVTQFVGQAVAKVISGITQLELAIYNLSVAEKSLSEQGVDITPEDFDDVIKSVQALDLAVSKIDITTGVAKLATGLRDLGLSKEQIEGLAKAAAIVANAKGLSMENVADQYVSGLAKGGKGLADLDIQVDAAVIKQRALDDQLVASEEAWDNLTASQRQNIETQALYNIVIDNANDSLSQLDLLQGSVTQGQKKLNAEWEDLTATAGVVFAPAIKGGLQVALALIKGLQVEIVVFKLLYVAFMSFVVGLSFTFQDLMSGNIKSVKEFGDAFKMHTRNSQIQLQNFMSPKAGEDNPTGTPPPAGAGVNPEAAIEDIAGALEKYNEEILKAQLKLEQDLTDVAIDLGRKMEDITIEYAKKRADAEKEYANKIADINRDYANKIASMDIKEKERKDKFRLDQQQKEKDYQNKLKAMQEQFLMDLDDALHARDARAVLKLIKKYELAKLQAERSHALDADNAKKDEALRQASFASERKQAEKEKQQKLADAQQDYALKVAKLKADEDAEVVAAVLSANRKIQDLEKNNKDRLAIIAANLVSEFNLTQKGLEAIATLYKKYYADISQMYAAMQAMMAGSGAPGAITKPNNQIRPTKGGGTQHRAMAEGGTIIANQPTTVTFGEAGMESASFTPIGRAGKDVNKIFSGLGNGGDNTSNGGRAKIEIILSPDLEGRIVANALGRTADVIMKSNRSK